MVIIFKWPRPHENQWSEEVAVSLLGAKTKINGTDGQITETQLDSNGDLLLVIDIKEEDDESLGHPV